jgi:uncharacterized protein YaeQ
MTNHKPASPTKILFCETYERHLRRLWAWTRDANKLAEFMRSVEQTLDGGNTWSRSGEAYDATLAELGLPKKTSLKALQSMPVGEPAQ